MYYFIHGKNPPIKNPGFFMAKALYINIIGERVLLHALL